MENMMGSFRCEDLKNGNNRHFRAFNAIARRAFLMGLTAIFPLIFAQTAHAQFCTAEQLNLGSTGFEGRDASGNPAGFDGNDVQVGDFLVFSDTVIAGYNPAAAIDVVFEITDINLNSAVPPHSADSGTVTVNNNNGRITLRSAISRSDVYVTYRVLPMLGGSVTSTVASGTQLSLINTEVSLQDVDSLTTRNASDVAGIANANPGNFTVSLNDTAQIPFQNGGGPAGFTTYTHTPVSLNPVSWDGAVAGGNLDHTVDLSYPTFTGGEYLHGFTGFETNSNTRGAVFALCGEIAEPELTTSKTLNSTILNADGTTDVSYTLNVENTGGQTLTGLNLTDDLDAVFSGAYDAFTPSTTANTSGGVITLDGAATIITDNGAPIGNLATNTSFNGGADINVFNPSNSISLDPNDEVSVTFVIRLNPNESGSNASFLNSINVSATDEFLLPVTSSSASAPVVVTQFFAPALDIEKVFSGNTDEDGSGSISIGDTLTYTITATNTSNVAQTNFLVTDNLLTPSSNSCAAVPVGGTCTLTGEYVVTVADAGSNFTNTASVVSDELPTPVEDMVTLAVDAAAPSFVMTKIADSAGPFTAGDTVTYTYTVTNDGNVSIRDVAISDTHNGSDPAPVPGNETLLTDAAPTGDSTDAATDNSWDVLGPGDTLTFTGTYTITQTDAKNL